MYAVAAAREPDNAQAQSRLVAALLRSGNRNQAEQVLTAAVQRLPNDRMLMVQLGACSWAAQGRCADAVRPPPAISAMSMRSMAGCADLIGRHRSAGMYRRAQALSPGPVAIATPGLSLLDNRPDEARAVLEPLARRPDATARVTANYAISLAATGDVAAAQNLMGEAGGDLAALGETFRGGTRQIIEVTPNDRPG